MNGAAYRYTMLISALPRHPKSLFSARQTPLSRIQLDERLRLLEPQDASDLGQIEAMLFWSQLDTASDAEIIDKYHLTLASIHSVFVKQQVLRRLEIRTLVAALRRRNRGEAAPEERELWGVGPWLRFIRNHWQQPDFGLAHRFSWLPEANTLLLQNKALALEKLLLASVWQQYSREAERHAFDFAAVVLYVLRWDIIQRWIQYDEKKAWLRFEQLLEQVLADVTLVEEPRT